MRTEKIKVVIFGVGNMGRAAVNFMLDKGCEIVGAIGRSRNIGKDVALVAGRKEPIGVPIESDVDAVLDRCGAEIAFISTQSGLEEVAELVKKCAARHINVVTISEEAYYPFVTKPALAKELDEICKQGGITMYASGMQEPFWSNLCTDLCASCQKIEKIDSVNVLPLEDMGPVVIDELYLGKTVEEFKELTKDMPAEENPLALVCLTAINANSAYMGLTIDKTTVSVEPILTEKDMYVPNWDITFPKGTIIGLDIIADMDTKEGIRWHSTLSFPVTDGAPHSIKWDITGVPNLHLEVPSFCGEITTCSTPVNRIPDVIMAEPGLKTVVDFPKAVYRFRPLHTYIKD